MIAIRQFDRIHSERLVINKSMFWLGLVGAAATIPLVQMAASAKSATEINKIAQSITVMISEPGSQGSGVILQKQGDIYTVLTAAHVVQNKNVSYSLTTPDGQKYQIIPDSIRRPTQDIDVAVIKFRANANYPTAKLGNSNLLSGGNELFVGGYPLPTGTITESVFVFRTGTVSANSNKTFDKGYSLIYSNDTLPGMSGGVVLNSAGELVAIHGRGDREKNSEGSLADFNRALQIDPNDDVTYHNRGYLKSYKLNDPKGALADFNRALQINPNSVKTYNHRGILKYQRLRDRSGGIADMQQAAKLFKQENNQVRYQRVVQMLKKWGASESDSPKGTLHERGF